MFQARTLYGLGVAIVAAAGLGVWQSDPAGPPDDGKERTAAERIVGTWSSTGSDRFKNVWWHSFRLHLYADGTWTMTSNDDWYVLRNERNWGTYKVVGGVLRQTTRKFADHPERPSTWESQVAVLTDTNLSLRTEREGGDPPRHDHYRRVR